MAGVTENNQKTIIEPQAGQHRSTTPLLRSLSPWWWLDSARNSTSKPSARRRSTGILHSVRFMGTRRCRACCSPCL